MTKKFILNADDFGKSKAHNRAVLRGYKEGILTSASIMADGSAFEDAVQKVIPQCPDLSIGVHLNIIEGKSLTHAPMLTDKNGIFNNSYGNIILKSFNKTFLEQTEQEFRAQIETVLSKTKADHIDSHVHTHAVPNIFKLAVKLAQEYKIPYVRTQFEHMYIIPSLKKHLTLKYPVNILKIILLDTFTKINLKTLKTSSIKTNDYLIGAGYTGMMDEDAVIYGLKALIKKECITEALIHPCDYENNFKDSHTAEFQLTLSKKLKEQIFNTGFELSNHTETFK